MPFKNLALKIYPLLVLLIALPCLSPFAQSRKYVYQKSDGTTIGSKTEFEFFPESQYMVKTQTGHITDITLRPNEVITYIGAGDTHQWNIDKAVVAGIAHVYIKPKAYGISTNMIINTNQSSYRLFLASCDTFDAIISWNCKAHNEAAKIKERNLPLQLQNKNKTLNFKYRIANNRKVNSEYCPDAIFDDGIHTYVKMNPSNKYDLPVIYNLEDKNLTLVNYRFKKNMFIIDRVFEKFRIQFTSKKFVDIVPT